MFVCFASSLDCCLCVMLIVPYIACQIYLSIVAGLSMLCYTNKLYRYWNLLEFVGFFIDHVNHHSNDL